MNTVINYINLETTTNHCGYCSDAIYGQKTKSAGLWVDRVKCEDYQLLMDRGWRRCGHYYYKPNLKYSCCRLYTIRLEPLKLNLKKSQKNVLRNFISYIENGEKRSTSSQPKPFPSIYEQRLIRYRAMQAAYGYPKSNDDDVFTILPVQDKKNQKTTDERYHINSFEENGDEADEEEEEEEEEIRNNELNSEKIIINRNYNNNNNNNLDCPTGKAKSRRWAMKVKRLFDQNLIETENDAQNFRKHHNRPKLLEERLSIKKECKHQFVCRLVLASTIYSNKRASDEEFELYKSYQELIHKDYKNYKNDFENFLVNSSLVDECENLIFTHPKYNPLEWENSTLLPLNFQVESFLNQKLKKGKLVYGSYHVQYRIDDSLIGVSVIDILPRTISSVYFFYDVKFAFLSLGTYSALCESALVRSLHNISPIMEFLYLGFYIHNNPKMAYKGKYSPSYILCPVTYHWVDFPTAETYLSQDNYCPLVSLDGAYDAERIILLEEDEFVKHLRRVVLVNDEKKFPFSDDVFYQNFLTSHGTTVIRYLRHYMYNVGREFCDRSMIHLSFFLLDHRAGTS
ncbi:hypothetical protein SNEBB_000137 [Seison nebaliae]|nr:hypothetical protein SNEBB_000137 [Seison nebaliae]